MKSLLYKKKEISFRVINRCYLMQTIRLIVLIQDTFSRMLDEADWLDEGTKISAKDKLYNMNLKVGYPDYIIDDEALDKDYDQVQNPIL